MMETTNSGGRYSRYGAELRDFERVSRRADDFRSLLNDFFSLNHYSASLGPNVRSLVYAELCSLEDEMRSFYRAYPSPVLLPYCEFINGTLIDESIVTDDLALSMFLSERIFRLRLVLSQFCYAKEFV